MYSLIRAYCKLINGSESWVEINVANLVLKDLFITYSRIILILAKPITSTTVAVDLASITPPIEGSNLTVTQFLQANGNKTLPQMGSVPTLNKKYVRYADAFHAGYKITPVKDNLPIDSVYPLSDKTWLDMRKPVVDYNVFHNTCLVNVNGFYHMTSTDGTSIRVVDGMKSQFKSGKNKIGILSFADIGNITQLPITSNMLFKQNDRQLYKTDVYINTGNTNLRNKTVMLVLGGYLHVLDNNVLSVIGDNIVRVSMSNLPYLERYFESKDIIDLSSMNLSTTVRNPNQVAISEIYSDAAIAAYFTLSQSFLVILDNQNVFLENVVVEQTKIPNVYFTEEVPQYPLVCGYGKISNYWYNPNGKIYRLNCDETRKRNYVFNSVDKMDLNSVDNALDNRTPYLNSNTRFLKIGSITI